MARLDLLTVGEAFEDLIFYGLPRLPHPGEEIKTPFFARTAGGGAVITSIAAARLGARCAVLSSVSSETAQMLRRERVRVHNLRAAREKDAVSVSLSTPSERSFVTFNGQNDDLEPKFLRALRTGAALLSPRHVHFALCPKSCARWLKPLKALRAAGCTLSWDFGFNAILRTDPALIDLVSSLDWLSLNEREALLYSRSTTMKRAAEFWRKCVKNAVIRLGKQGCLWIRPRAEGDLNVPAKRFRTVDTTGAGDSFNGGMLFGRLRGLPDRECLRLANQVAGMSTRAAGGIDGLPHRSEIPWV